MKGREGYMIKQAWLEMNNNKQELGALLRVDLVQGSKGFQDLNHFLIKAEKVDSKVNNHLVIYLKNLRRCLEEEEDKECLKEHSNRKEQERDKTFQY